MKAVVTGANGFIGSHICEHLLRAGWRVSALVRPSGNREFIRDLGPLEVFEGDICDPGSLTAPMKGALLVFHAAGYVSDWGPWRSFRAVNVGGTRNVLEAARAAGVKRVVHISSVSVYGFPGTIDVSEEGPFVARRDDPYVTTKREGEQAALSYHDREIEVCAVRPAGVFGPRDRTTTMQLAPVLLAGKFAFVDGGRHVMAPVYIDNLVQLLLLAGQHERAPGRAYNAVDDGFVTWREYAGWLCEDLGCKRPQLSIPRRIAWPAAVAVEGTAKLFGRKESPLINKYRVRAVMSNNHYSTMRAKRELGYRPRTSTREGIRRTVDWYRHYTGMNGDA